MKRLELIQNAHSQKKTTKNLIVFCGSLFWSQCYDASAARGSWAARAACARGSHHSDQHHPGFILFPFSLPIKIIPVSSYSHLVSQPGSSRFHPTSFQSLNLDHPGFILIHPSLSTRIIPVSSQRIWIEILKIILQNHPGARMKISGLGWSS